MNPYIEKTKVVTEKFYNPSYGDDRLCECGHRYQRHFDTYEDMLAVGCKYCRCFEFKEFTGDINEVVEWYKQTYYSEYQKILRFKIEKNFSDEFLHEYCLEAKYKEEHG